MDAPPKAPSIVLEVLRTQPAHLQEYRQHVMYLGLLLRSVVEDGKYVVRPRTQLNGWVRARLEYTQATEAEMIAAGLGEDRNEVWHECRAVS